MEEVEVLENSVKQFKYDLSKLCWYMRGSVSLTEMYETCHEDREVMSQLVQDNLETAKKTQQPFF
tara:strand:- start:27 stop:221 length:195 start_codon:yes stop_codon:yes gene_type:complete